MADTAETRGAMAIRRLDLGLGDVASCLSGNSTVMVIGKTCRGKTALVRDILSRRDNSGGGVAMSRRQDADAFYRGLASDVAVYPRFDGEVVDEYVRKRLQVRKHDTNGFLIIEGLDDSASDWTKNHGMMNMFVNNRQLGSMMLTTMESPMSVPIQMRTNLDWTFIFAEANARHRETLYAKYAGMFDSLQVFCQVLDECAGDERECLAINNIVHSNRLVDRVFWYRSEP